MHHATESRSGIDWQAVRARLDSLPWEPDPLHPGDHPTHEARGVWLGPDLGGTDSAYSEEYEGLVCIEAVRAGMYVEAEPIPPHSMFAMEFRPIPNPGEPS